MEIAAPVDRCRVQRIRLLNAIYDLSDADVYQTVSLVQAGKNAGIDDYDEVLAAASYLDRKGLAHLDGGGWSAQIMTPGIDFVEQLRSPIPEVPVSPAVVNNTVNNYGHISGSVLQGGRDALFLTPNEVEKLQPNVTAFANALKGGLLTEQSLPTTEREALASSLNAVEAEVQSTRPKKAVIKAHLGVVVDILKLVGGGSEAIAQIVKQAKELWDYFH